MKSTAIADVLYISRRKIEYMPNDNMRKNGANYEII